MKNVDSEQLQRDLKQALELVRMYERRNAKLVAQGSEPIAILSMACRLPGGIDDPESYWRTLATGVDAIGPFPRRWDGIDLYDPDPDATGKSYAREGGFLGQVEAFDAAFFGISAREAQEMDPQQRVLLETVWEALERAWICPLSLNESPTGVYVGQLGSDYGAGVGRCLEDMNGYVATGAAGSVLSGRVAYLLGLQGPAVTVDTACSSSLVALHLACSALRQGECELALAGGVTVMTTPLTFVEFSRLRGLSPAGRCRSFSAQADGVGWGEGCGVLVLKRLSDAQRDGDSVLAVIRGTAVNQDGRSQGLSAPNGPAQERVIRNALKAGKLAPDDIDLVEAHGTGTTLGDPIEAGALSEVFGSRRDCAGPLYLGSSKSNLGHTQAAAGVAGVIKLVLALQHELMPKTLHVGEPSPHVAWEGSGLSLLKEARAWSRGQRIRRGGVSSFGVSGTNAHVVIEEAPAPLAAQQASVVAEVPYALPLLVSGRDEPALRGQAQRLCGFLRAHPEARWVDIVHTAALHRTHFDSRAVVIAAGAGSSVEARGFAREQYLEALEALAQGQGDLRVVRGVAGATGRVVFVFPGQGSQWPGMGKALLEQSEVFAESVRACDAALSPWTGWSVLSLLRGDAGPELPPYDRVDAVQMSLFAMCVGLSALWRSLGLEPAAVVGHSQGEVAAAVVSGALSLADGARIVAARSQAVRACCGAGGMLLVERPVSEVEERLKRYGSALSVAAVNTASSTVVSGDNLALSSLKSELESASVFCRLVNVDYASHSAHMDGLLPGLMRELTSLSPRAGQIPFYSTVSGQRLSGEQLDGSYWCRNLREPVRFDRSLTQLLDDGHGVFVEVSAHPVLGVALRSGSEERGGLVIGSLAREQGGLDALLRGLGELHAHGHAVDWKAVLRPYGGRRVALPTYAFQRERFWSEAGRGRSDARSMGLVPVEHPLLGAMTQLADGDGYLFVSRLLLPEQRGEGDQGLDRRLLGSNSCFLELALQAARSLGMEAVSELTVEQPLAWSGEGTLELQLQVSVSAADERAERSIVMHSRRQDEDWRRHARGTLSAGSREQGQQRPEFDELRGWPVAGAEPVELADFHARRDAAEQREDAPCGRLVEVCSIGSVAYGRALLPETVKASAERYALAPTLLDAALDTLNAASLFDDPDTLQQAFSWSDVRLYATGASELRVRVERKELADSAEFAVSFADGAGEPVASIGSLQARPVKREQTASAQRMYRLEFQPVVLESARDDAEPQAVLGGTGALARLLGASWYEDLESLLAAEPQERTLKRVIIDATEGVPDQAELLAAVHGRTAGALSLLRGLLQEERLSQAELLWVTCSAVAGGEDWELRDLVHAPLWGLVRAARSEHMERALRLLDIESPNATEELLALGVSATSEPELALRGGTWRAARLARAPKVETHGSRALDPFGTVLITGGTGELGTALATHLVSQHGVKHLVLASRRGAEAPGTDQLIGSLHGLGAISVEVLACDVAVRAQLEAVLSGIPSSRPLTGVFHLSAVLDDGLLEAQTAQRLSRVLEPKVNGSWHLHELTQDQDLACFALFSSASGTLGSAGQCTYAAANTFLDGLAAHRRQRGLAGTSLAWGLWQPSGTGLTGRLKQADLARMARAGIAPLSLEQGLALLDTALGRREPQLVPIRLELATLQRSFEQVGAVPGLWRALVRPSLRRASGSQVAASALRVRLSALSESERLGALLELVQAEVATVLGLGAPSAVPADKELMKLGLDSLLAVELRNRLSALAGTTLPATLAFDYPTPRGIAGWLLKQAFGELEPAKQTARLARRPARTNAGSEPIAIVAMACRLAGGIDSPDAYWRVLASGQDMVSGFPARWEGLDLYDPNPDAVGKSYAREGGFLHGVELFDAGFFGTSPREASAMDPQQRLLLETSWEALERAGIPPWSLNESLTGVYMGAVGADYGACRNEGLERFNGYAVTGTTMSVLCGRVAYVLGLQGPAFTVDTGCSSSLTALHLACTGLRQGECDLALAGGVTVMTTPGVFVEFSRLRGMASDGRCKSFSARADGAGWGEGCGVLVLKRLSDARRDGDRVLALVRASAVNQDGRSQGLSAPNGPSQQRVIRDALSSIGLSPSDIDALEAHGTGTTLGDPIEAGALAAVFGPGRAPERPLYLGSAKSNLGHTHAAAGVAGVIKMVLSLQHELLPKTLHAEEPSPHIAWEGSGLSLLQEARAWQRGQRTRRAGVSGFGIGGSNAHVVLEEPPAAAGSEEPSAAEVPFALPLLVSGRDEAALRAQAQRLAAWLRDHGGAGFVDVVHTAALHRTHFEERAVVMASEASSSAQALEVLAQGQRDARVLCARARALGKVVFVFPGQGSQWPGMAKALLSQSEVFAESVRACDAALSPCTGWSVLALLQGEEGAQLPPVDRVDAVQISLFVLGVSLAALWRSLGLEPAAVVGHSQGEVAAAVVSGALSLEDGARVVAARSQAVRKVCGAGGMLLVERPVAELEERLKRYGDVLSIAAVNTASSTVVSGESAALAALKSELESDSVFCRLVAVDYASHSAQMDVLLPGLRAELAQLSPRAGEISLYSTVEARGSAGEPNSEGSRRLGGEELDGAYWCRNLREPVRFDRALQQLLDDGHGVFVEVSAHPVLGVALRSATEERGGVVIGSLQREQGCLGTLLGGLGELHAHGYAVDWGRVLRGYGGRRVDLPTYAFQRERFWHADEKLRSDARSMGLLSVEHPLLGALTPLADGEGYVFSGRLSLSEQSWLGDHAVSGTVLLPGTGLLELTLHVARTLGRAEVSELTLEQPLVVPREGALQVQVSVGSADAQGERPVSVYSREDEEDASWQRHASGTLAGGSSAAEDVAPQFESLRSWPVPGTESVDLTGLYPRLWEAGLQYGASFRGLTEAYRDGSVVYGRVLLPAPVKGAAQQYGVHPALLDAALHLMAALSFDEPETVQLPFAWSEVCLHATGASELRVRMERKGDVGSGPAVSVLVADGAGEPVASIGALQVRPARLDELHAAQQSELKHLYRVAFQPVPLDVGPDGRAQVVVGGRGTLAQRLDAPWYADLEALLTHGAEDEAPQRVIVDATEAEAAEESGFLASVHAHTAAALSLLQGLLSAERLSQSELVWVTSSAVACGADSQVEDLVHAPLWGLIRAARNEHPERCLRLVDVAGLDVEGGLLARGLSATREAELALRGEAWLAARLCAARSTPEQGALAPGLDGEVTVLITGGTGELGSALAEHLVVRHGAKHLLLTSRRGDQALGTSALIGRLCDLGARTVQVLACDVTVRSQVEAVLSSIPSSRPLAGVFHLSAVLDDGLVEVQTAERLSPVLAPKVDGSWHLHELTQHHDLTCFVLFSGASGTIGGAGQSNYAAANTFVDALAASRSQRGLPALSLAWGLWQPSGTGLTGRLKQADLARMARAGIAPLSQEQALALFDAALCRQESHLVPIRLELGAMRHTFEQAGAVPSLWRALLRPSLRRASASRSSEANALRTRILALPESERLAAMVEIVQGEIAAVLGLSTPAAVAPDRELMKLGLDSMMALEVRNRLTALAGKLPATLAFDYPTPRAMAGLLLEQLGSGALEGSSQQPPKDAQGALKWALQRVSASRLEESGLLSQIISVAQGGSTKKAGSNGAKVDTNGTKPASQMSFEEVQREIRAKLYRAQER